MSFRARATRTIVVVTTVALGAAFSGVSAVFNVIRERQLDASLLAEARAEAALAATSEPLGPTVHLRVVLDERGRPLSSSSAQASTPAVAQNGGRSLDRGFDFSLGDESLRGVFVSVPGHPGRRLFLATSRADLDGEEALLVRAMLAAFIVSVAWVAAIAYYLAGRLTREHHGIAGVARKVAKGDLRARVEIRSRDPEIVQMAADINDMVDKLGNLLTSQQRFIAYAAHELRTPLAALYGELQQSVRKEREAQSYRAAIEKALTSTRRLNNIAEDLLTLARVRGADTDPDRGGYAELSSLLLDAVHDVGTMAEERDITVEIAGDTSPRISGTGNDVARLIRNLLENAIRHAPAGSAVRVTVSNHGDDLHIAVTDEGPGVPEAERQAIFEPFFRGRSHSHLRGTGLGLGIAREIARSRGGDVVLDESPPKGARFVVSLPAAAGH